jgi:hypothetical protein
MRRNSPSVMTFEPAVALQPHDIANRLVLDFLQFIAGAESLAQHLGTQQAANVVGAIDGHARILIPMTFHAEHIGSLSVPRASSKRRVGTRRSS